jgi:hypothetical protein
MVFADLVVECPVSRLHVCADEETLQLCQTGESALFRQRPLAPNPFLCTKSSFYKVAKYICTKWRRASFSPLLFCFCLSILIVIDRIEKNSTVKKLVTSVMKFLKTQLL